MKVRFYCDVWDSYSSMPNAQLYATTVAPSSSGREGMKRVAFDVDIPDSVLRPFDLQAPATTAQVIE